MRPLAILDVTLRDGGYRNNFQFTQDFAIDVVRGLAETGVPFVEVGYWNGSFAPRPDHGLTSKVNGEYLDALARASDGRTSICVMVHPHNVVAADFEMMARHHVDMVRVCLRDDRLDDGLATIRLAKRYGFIVSANVTRATEIPLSAIARISTRAEQAGADLLCVADTNGSMIPSDVDRVFTELSSCIDIPLGFHAHNHLSLALANAISAITVGAEYIDVSISGMGKGAGNLHLSILIAYLDRVGRQHNYDLVQALQISAYAAKTVRENNEPHPLIDVMLGAYNFSIDVRQKVATGQPENLVFEQLRALHEEGRLRRPRLLRNTPGGETPRQTKHTSHRQPAAQF